MEAPRERLTPQEFNEEIEKYYAEHYEKVDGGYKCKKCEAVIQQTTLWISIHTALFKECAGYGDVRDVKRFPLSYCPNCEGRPKKTSTCVHFPFDKEKLARLAAI